jgi:hypothetical protein
MAARKECPLTIHQHLFDCYYKTGGPLQCNCPKSLMTCPSFPAFRETYLVNALKVITGEISPEPDLHVWHWLLPLQLALRDHAPVMKGLARWLYPYLIAGGFTPALCGFTRRREFYGTREFACAVDILAMLCRPPSPVRARAAAIVLDELPHCTDACFGDWREVQTAVHNELELWRKSRRRVVMLRWAAARDAYPE